MTILEQPVGASLAQRERAGESSLKLSSRKTSRGYESSGGSESQARPPVAPAEGPGRIELAEFELFVCHYCVCVCERAIAARWRLLIGATATAVSLETKLPGATHLERCCFACSRRKQHPPQVRALTCVRPVWIWLRVARPRSTPRRLRLRRLLLKLHRLAGRAQEGQSE